ncbi:MAG: hypothetical protein BZY79_01995 [SAR202 cluster bacterium Casp-Chloro-G4]|nr:hypothetical protein [Chloroflexota bacterium]MDA1228744.1 hypothetical protein [Chloroflexota bacterium]PKB61797.1 MAG: hypothetical protein BZY79_01995 [SAR202 cluster bacterium Casp-Chloro-G4]
MVTEQNIDTLISSVEQAVQAGVAFFQANSNSETRVGLWTGREFLCHLIYWHQATVDGIASVSGGGAPVQVYASVDEMNARSVGRQAGKSVAQLLEQVGSIQESLISSARSISDPNAVVLINSSGSGMSTAQRLERIATHWNEHIAELK